MIGGEAATGEERSRQVQGPPLGLPPPHGDDRRAGAERVQPLGRRRHPGADDRDAVGVLVRLVCVDCARVVLELRREGEARMTRGEQDVAEGAEPVELEAAFDRADALDPRSLEALVPARPLPQLGGVLEELGDGRVVPVEDAQHERTEAPAPPRLPHRQARERGGEAVPVALRAHQPLPDRGDSRAPDPGRIGVRAEDADLVRLEAAVAQRLVRREPGEPASHDRDLGGHAPEPKRAWRNQPPNPLT